MPHAPQPQRGLRHEFCSSGYASTRTGRTREVAQWSPRFQETLCPSRKLGQVPSGRDRDAYASLLYSSHRPHSTWREV